MWSVYWYYKVGLMHIGCIRMHARCRASGVLVPLACFVGGKYIVPAPKFSRYPVKFIITNSLYCMDPMPMLRDVSKLL